MTTIQNQQAASPKLLYFCGALMTAGCLLLAASAPWNVVAFFWAITALPLLVAGVVRTWILSKRGETFLWIEPQPLLFGEPFAGYIETGRAFDISKDTVILQSVRSRYAEVWWESANLRRSLAMAPDGRQRLEFAGTMPQHDELSRDQILAQWRLHFRRAYFPLFVKR